MPPLVVLCGPTCSGKTGLSLRIAATLPGAQVICADSRQVYRGMDIGTAKATPAERALVPHHGLDLADPDKAVSVADWASHAGAALQGIAAAGGVALLVGGTGLYLRTLARGLPIEATGHDPGVRAELEARLARDGLTSLAAELGARDPRAAQVIDLRNPRRVVRALERARLTGRALPPAPRGYPGPVLWLGLAIEPTALAARIGERVRAQFAGGLLDEAETLRARYGEGPSAFSAMGYREAFDVLAGRRALDEAVGETARRTRVYARRQRTWLRAEPGIIWLPADDGPQPAALDEVSRFLDAIDSLHPETA